MTRPSFFSALALIVILAEPSLSSDDSALRVTHTQNTEALTTYDVFEITFEHPNHYASPFQDVTVDVTFQSPFGKRIPVGGFHYGSLQPPTIKLPPAIGRGRPVYEFADQSIWKARFAPSELGTWKYSFTFTAPEGRHATGAGEFRVVEVRRRHPGFLRQHPSNPFRWVHDDGDGFADEEEVQAGTNPLERASFPAR